MPITTLKKQRDDINSQMIDHLKKDTALLKTLADSMAECATNIHGHGYVTFVAARDEFLSQVDRIQKDYSYYVCSHEAR